jgi:hypothetical protein
MIELIRDIETDILTKFHDDRGINATAREL